MKNATTQTIMRIIAANIESRTPLSIALRAYKNQVYQTRYNLLRQCLGDPLTQVLPISVLVGSMYNERTGQMQLDYPLLSNV
jgi:hypothetical protein